MFADDLAIVSVHKDSDQAVSNLKKEFNVFQLLVHDMELTLNFKKTEILHNAFHTMSRKPLKITAHSNKCLHEQTPLNWKQCFCSNSLKTIATNYCYCKCLN